MYEFINPYNFVPFNEDVPQTIDKEEIYRGEKEQENLLSGWLDVSILIKTPLIIPDGAHPKYYDLKQSKYVESKISIKNQKKLHIEYDFFKTYNPETEEKEYTVSGSEIRGMIRSTYEAVTNSCVPFLLNDKSMSQRVPLYGALTRRGLLGYDGSKWVLYETEKKLEEVIVVPIYEVDGNYYVQSLDEVRSNEDNNKLDTNGNFKYQIMESLDKIEKKLEKFKWKSRQIYYGAEFRRNRNDNKKWDIQVSGERKVIKVDKKIIHYLFIKADGNVIKEETGTLVNEDRWLQYNVPVDTRRIYHVAYLKKKDEIYKWEKSTARGKENKEKERDTSYAEAYKKLKSALDRDGASGNNTNVECNSALKKALEVACEDKTKLVPIYYFIVSDGDKKIAYISGSAAGRIAQRRKWKEIMSGHTPCETKFCPACLLFGSIKSGGMKGHVRFSDAFMSTPQKQSAETSRHTLQILSTPRTTAFEFYLKKPHINATYWNYDFYGVTKYKDDGKNESSHTEYYHLEKAMPRGRKMYWHHSLAQDDRKSNLNNTVESLDKGRFSFRLYFDQITNEQLKDLIWAITLGENKGNSKLQHKLGHAKPLGYGSVKLIVDDGKVRQFYSNSQKTGFKFELKNLSEIGIDVNNITPSFDLESKEVKCLLKMSNVGTVEVVDNVGYPRTRENGFIYEWFSKNRTNSKKLVTLPEPEEKILSLGREECLKEGDIVEAIFDDFAEKKDNNYRFGIFVKLPNDVMALMHKNSAKNKKLESYEGKKIQVKIEKITVDGGRKKYSVTDKL